MTGRKRFFPAVGPAAALVAASVASDMMRRPAPTLRTRTWSLAVAGHAEL